MFRDDVIGVRYTVFMLLLICSRFKNDEIDG